MGYTHYIHRPATLDALRWSFLLDDVRTIIAALPDTLTLEDIQLTPDRIRFNGPASATCETFHLIRVRAPRYAEDKPQPKRLGNDTIAPALFFDFCKTNQLPYDLAVCAVLLRFARHYPDALVATDGEPEDFADALDFIARVFPRDARPVDVIVRQSPTDPRYHETILAPTIPTHPPSPDHTPEPEPTPQPEPKPEPTPAPEPVQSLAPDRPESIQIQRDNAERLANYYLDRADRWDKMATDAERPSTQNHTPKRGRQWAVKRHDAANLRRAEAAARALAAAWRTNPDLVPLSLRDKLTASQLLSMVSTRGKSESYYHYADSYQPVDQSPRACDLRQFVESFDTEAQAREAERKAQADLQQRIDALRYADIEGFFPSPPAVVQRVIELASLAPGLRVLEPSAGLGDLAIAAKAQGCDVRAYEISPPLVDILRQRGIYTTEANFLDTRPDSEAALRFDRVIMNPPFERQAAPRHVLHALRFLKPGGILVAVMPTTPIGDELARLLESDHVAHFTIRPIGQAFNTPDTFRRTGVNIQLLTIELSPATIPEPTPAPALVPTPAPDRSESIQIHPRSTRPVVESTSIDPQDVSPLTALITRLKTLHA